MLGSSACLSHDSLELSKLPGIPQPDIISSADMRDYAGRLGEIRKTEYPHAKGYLDNAASPLYPSSIPLSAAKVLIQEPLVNPHSHGRWAVETGKKIDAVRAQVLHLLNADPKEYAVVFTQNATAATKLIGECIYDSKYVFLRDSHTSLIGLRALAASYAVKDEITETDYRNTLVSYPLQSNFNGQRYPATWVDRIAAGKGLSLVDLAAYCATSMPNFAQFKPDFAVMSFYKIFGLPDLGALIVRKTPATIDFLQRRKYFGGGTVAALTPENDFMVRSQNLVDSLEDGTLPFHNIVMLGVAMQEFSRLYGTFDAISQHTQDIANYCRDRLENTQLCEVLSPKNAGPVVTFTLKHGGYYDFDLVASQVGIQVRTGTLCNIGAFLKHSDITEEEVIRNHVTYGKVCNDAHDILDGRHTGVIRASVGPYTSRDDIDMLLECVKEYFSEPLNQEKSVKEASGVVTHLVIYPIKSCAGTRLSKATVTLSGLKWDREFCLVSLTDGKILRLKKHPQMALLRSTIEEDAGVLVMEFAGRNIRVPIDCAKWNLQDRDIGECSCISSELIFNYDRAVINFLSRAIGTNCTLAKAAPEERFSKETQEQTLANSSPLLFVSESSSKELGINHEVFRGNIVFEAPAYVEDSWQRVRIGGKEFEFSAPCQRCNMICFTPEGKSDAQPYLILTKHRKVNGKIYFGQLGSLAFGQGPTSIKVGDRLKCIS